MQPSITLACRKALSSVMIFLLVILTSGVALAQPHPDGSRSTPRGRELPAVQAFGQWLEQQGSWDRANLAEARTLAKGLELAQARKVELLALMQTDPAAFARAAMPESHRAQLPGPLQALVERQVSGRGFFGVYCIFPVPEAGAFGEAADAGGHRGGFAYEVRLEGKPYRAFVYGKWKDQKTVYDAQIEGIVLDDAIVLGDAPTPSEQGEGGQIRKDFTPSATGPNTLLYMIARFSDETNDPAVEATVLSQLTVVSNFWKNNSGGAVCLRGIVNSNQAADFVHIALPQPRSYGATYNNNFGQLLGDARAAASAQGYNYSGYNLDAVVTSSQGFGYAGRAYVGGQGAHLVAPYTSLRTAGHELGHNLGLWHANYWRTDATSSFGKDSVPNGYVADQTEGEWVEYGHYFSVMSAQFGGEWDDATKPHYSAAEKVTLGWLSGNEVQYVSSSGTYRLFRHDARDTVGTPRAIRIETAATDYTGYGHRYWLQYRYAPWSAAQNWFRNGLQVDVAQTGYGSDGAIQLDMTPYSKDQATPFYDRSSPPGSWWTIDNSDKLDGALVVGRTYNDSVAGIRITPIATGSNGTNEEYIDLVINLGSMPGNRPPVVTAFTSSTNRVPAGQAVTFAVAASDPDGDTLAYAWDFDEVQVWTASGLNSATAFKSWSSAGQYRVVATVSDMKGGVATASWIITVGSPANTHQIWGRVLWAGSPVYGARVWTTNGSAVLQAWTATDGCYALTDLPASGSFTVACGKTGLTFTPQFTNPVAMAGADIYGADFYANEPLVGGGGTSYTLSGRVTDPVNGAAGVEVRGGGLVGLTDASGNYALTNLLNGTYTVTPVNLPWTFSPANRSVTINSADSTGNNFARVAPYSISGTFSGIPAGAQNPAPTLYLSNGRAVTATRAGTGGNRYWAYTINNVPAGQYSITAELYGYAISPSGFANPLTISGNVSGVNFVGTSSSSIAGAISGRITLYGTPLADVTVSANQGGSTIASEQTDSDGGYRIANLPGGAYTVIPAKAGFTFSPASIAVSSVPSGGNNFTATTASAPPPIISSVTATPAILPGVSATTVLSAVATGSGTLVYSWDATVAAGPVVFSVNDSGSAANTTAGFQAPGLYTFRVRVVDTNGFAATRTVNLSVTAGPGSLVVSPYEVQVPAGRSVSFHADAWDQLGSRITASPAWAVNGGGSIDSTGLFTATAPGGPFQVVAVSSGLSATGLVWVTTGLTNVVAPIIQSIVATNGTVTITWSAIPGVSYRVEAKDLLTNTTWSALSPSVVATTNFATKTDVYTGSSRFYRVLVVP